MWTEEQIKSVTISFGIGPRGLNHGGTERCLFHFCSWISHEAVFCQSHGMPQRKWISYALFKTGSVLEAMDNSINANHVILIPKKCSFLVCLSAEHHTCAVSTPALYPENLKFGSRLVFVIFLSLSKQMLDSILTLSSLMVAICTACCNSTPCQKVYLSV
jgi:hypothetical protein